MDYSIKVELGCGQSKAIGYIGVDRFPLDGVDVVADLNCRFPFDDDSVDVIWACHSLEHLENIGFTMSEVYRVLRHGGLFLVLAPYYWQSVGIVNHYHIVPFTEELFRFYSQLKSSQLCDYQNFDDCPHTSIYGLALSDNSKNKVNFEPLYQESFYYESFRGLPEAEKERARRNLLNVCDQFYIAVAANKSGEPLSEEALDLLRIDAKKLEPAVVTYVRERDNHCDHAKGSILSDMDAHIASESIRMQEKLTCVAEKLDADLAKLENRNEMYSQQTALELERLSNQGRLHADQLVQLSAQGEQHTEYLAQLSAQGAQHTDHLAQLSAQYVQHTDQLVQLSAQGEQHTNQLAQLLAQCAQYTDQLAQLSAQGTQHVAQLAQLEERIRKSENAVYEQACYQDRHSGLWGRRLFCREHDLCAGIAIVAPQFMGSLALQFPSLGKRKLLTYSSVLPCEQPMTYQIKCKGNWLHLFVSGGGGASISVVIKSNGVTIYEGVILSNIEGETILPCSGAGDMLCVEVRLLENRGVVRLLEITSRKWIVFTEKTLAAFCTD